MAWRRPPEELRERVRAILDEAWMRAVAETGFDPEDVDWSIWGAGLPAPSWEFECRSDGDSADYVVEAVAREVRKLDPSLSVKVYPGRKRAGEAWCGEARGEFRYDGKADSPGIKKLVGEGLDRVLEELSGVAGAERAREKIEELREAVEEAAIRRWEVARG